MELSELATALAAYNQKLCHREIRQMMAEVKNLTYEQAVAVFMYKKMAKLEERIYKLEIQLKHSNSK